MSMSPWAPYRPTADVPWNLARAWTLRRRAGFAATWRELERDVADGPGPAVDRVLSGECRSEGVPADFDRLADLIGDGAAGSSDARRLQAWWLYRAMFTPHPLLERMTLMWHDHFATSQLKVDDVAAMRRQNETFRRLALGPFGDLLRAMLRDRALLVWLDAPSNRKGKPNENLARELMELFTLGVGHYSEADVKEAARALTGRAVIREEVPGPGRRTTTEARRSSSARRDASTATRSPTSSSSNPRRRSGSPGGSARRSSAKGLPTPRPSARSSPMSMRSRRPRTDRPGGRGGSCDPPCSSPIEICMREFPTRSGSSSDRYGRWSGSHRRRARSCWRNGRGGSGRSCSSRRTSGAGRAGGGG